jgi:hypothetical protein
MKSRISVTTEYFGPFNDLDHRRSPLLDKMFNREMKKAVTNDVSDPNSDLCDCPSARELVMRSYHEGVKT